MDKISNSVQRFGEIGGKGLLRAAPGSIVCFWD
jgi:hypothetical protein